MQIFGLAPEVVDVYRSQCERGTNRFRNGVGVRTDRVL
jgi:hypothetical protein